MDPGERLPGALVERVLPHHAVPAAIIATLRLLSPLSMSTSNERDAAVPRRWARLRFSILGPLLAAPPEHGELRVRIEKLAAKPYQHPTTGEVVRFGASTIERWFYTAKDAADPVAALARKIPSHAGTHPGMPAAMAVVLEAQYRAHPGWSFQRHHDNLRALARERPATGPPSSYPTTSRFMKDRGWLRHKRKKKRRDGDGADEDIAVREPRETRSFEVSHATRCGTSTSTTARGRSSPRVACGRRPACSSRAIDLGELLERCRDGSVELAAHGATVAA